MAKLSLISLPIGNIEDITYRAKSLLEKETFFLAEDTRKIIDLMKRLGIDISNKKFLAFHDHSDEKYIASLLRRLESNEDLFLVSDAGSPIISDPAYPLVRAVLEGGYEVDSITGVSAVTCALELAGLPPHPFTFSGFIAREDEKKSNYFEECAQTKGTYLFFESPQRILKTLDVMKRSVPNVQVSVCRELTKTYQSIYRFCASDFCRETTDIVEKGEFVVVFHVDSSSKGANNKKLNLLVNDYMAGKRSTKALAKIFSELTGQKTKEIYSQLSSES